MAHRDNPMEDGLGNSESVRVKFEEVNSILDVRIDERKDVKRIVRSKYQYAIHEKEKVYQSQTSDPN